MKFGGNNVKGKRDKMKIYGMRSESSRSGFGAFSESTDNQLSLIAKMNLALHLKDFYEVEFVEFS